MTLYLSPQSQNAYMCQSVTEDTTGYFCPNHAPTQYTMKWAVFLYCKLYLGKGILM